MNGFPTSCIEYYAKANKMTVSDVYKELYDDKSIESGSTNQSTKCVFRNTPEFNVKSLFYGEKGVNGTCRFISDKDDKLFINETYFLLFLLYIQWMIKRKFQKKPTKQISELPMKHIKLQLNEIHLSDYKM